MSSLAEDIEVDSIAYGLRNLRRFHCRVVRSILVQGCTKAPITVSSPAAGLLLIECHSYMVEKHKSMIALGKVYIFPGRLLKLRILSAKPILFTKCTVVAYTSIASDFILHHVGKSQVLSDVRKGLLRKQSFWYDKCRTREWDINAEMERDDRLYKLFGERVNPVESRWKRYERGAIQLFR